MNKNNSLKEIAQVLKDSRKILLFPHINMDGDALGSSVALCRTLRRMGKDAYILIEDTIAEFLKFLDNGYCTSDLNVVESPDVCICVDCGDADRFKARKNKFFSGKIKCCIDHHVTTQPFTDLNYIDPNAAATGEIIFDLMKELGVSPDEETAGAVFTAITTDTGNFQYSNTTKKTHLIAAELYEYGLKSNGISVELYQNNRPEKLLLQTRILQDLMIFAEGKAAICGVTEKMLEQTCGLMEETEGIIEILRSLSGVEAAVFVKEIDGSRCKISMRSKKYLNVAEISKAFNGGGHERAAGCTVPQGYEDAKKTMIDLILKNLEG